MNVVTIRSLTPYGTVPMMLVDSARRMLAGVWVKGLSETAIRTTGVNRDLVTEFLKRWMHASYD